MFEIGFSEILLIAIVALVAIGPEDLPGLLFRFGRLMRQVKMVMNDFRNQYADVMHEAEVDHYRQQIIPGKVRGAPVMKPLEIKDGREEVVHADIPNP